jgi:fructose 5-dehydrogenase cytochrome subunit
MNFRPGRAVLVAGAAFGIAAFANAAFAQGAAPAATPQSLVEKGRYLATAADCAACHTAPGGHPFAGGYALATPLGAIYSTNITPSKSAGIGDYTEAEFASAVRDGIRRDGAHLYPAMPYTAYSGMTDADISALYAYFKQEVAADDTIPKQTSLPFPFSVGASMAGWNLLFHDSTRFQPDPAKSGEQNRGAYLVDVLGHCGTCHTPRNFLMAEDKGASLSGASLGNWYAPNITSDPRSGIGAWSEQELVDYLRTGHVQGKGQAAGPMAEAVQNSLQYLSDPDLHAIAATLKASPPVATTAAAESRFAYGQAANLEPVLRGAGTTPTRGQSIFSGNCATCHQPTGAGGPGGAYPQLFHNTATGAANTTNLIATVLYGVDRVAGGQHAFMPAFGPSAPSSFRLADQDVADVSNYVLKQFGDPAAASVTAQDVATVRQGGEPPLLARLAPAAMPALVLAGLVILALLCWRVLRNGRKQAATSASHPAGHI